MLLKMIDGVYNSKRKLYILTTNRLAVDENLLGRPGRIRYIKEFANLPAKAVSDVIDDNLNDPALKDGILKLVDTLEISTIDILKAIIDECNIMGEVPADTMLNIPKAKYKVRVISFDDLDENLHGELRDYITHRLAPGETVEEWLMTVTGTDDKKKDKPQQGQDRGTLRLQRGHTDATISQPLPPYRPAPTLRHDILRARPARLLHARKRLGQRH